MNLKKKLELKKTTNTEVNTLKISGLTILLYLVRNVVIPRSNIAVIFITFTK